MSKPIEDKKSLLMHGVFPNSTAYAGGEEGRESLKNSFQFSIGTATSKKVPMAGEPLQ
jgi:hypothetical protein